MTLARLPARPHRILDAAEQAFGELGFAGASLRHISRAAGVNLATAYYYFGSKEGLMEAVLKRRFGPLRAAHVEKLRAAQQTAGNRPLTVEVILEAMLGPSLRVAIAAPANRQAVTRLLGRIVTEPNPRTQEFLRRQHAEVRMSFLQAMHRAVPGLPLSELHWRMEFVWGALGVIMCNPRRLERDMHGAGDPVMAESVLEEMIAFFAPGFRAGRRPGSASRKKTAGQIPQQLKTKRGGALRTFRASAARHPNGAAR
jgi:AcrR family transcriptional regulator